ncbi:Hypothetical protein A7982_02971 [Minicystis rosea]|nr:Hypothetical protein A7982_02971 [Minicystis rosea]
MGNPYREPPPLEPRGAGGSLGLPTVIFGSLCVLMGYALGGPACGLFATIAGVVLILSPSRLPR